MPTRVQLRRGTTAEHSTFTGAVGEVTVDTDKDVVVVHDGATAGGFPLASTVSPAFTGTPAAPTAAASTNTTQIATTAFVIGTANTYAVAQRGAVSAQGSVSGTVTLNFATANNFSMTLPAGGSITLANPSNLTAGQSGSIVITQNGTTAATVAYGTYWKFSGGTPTMSTGLSSVSTLAYYVESSTRITAQLLTNVA